MNVLQVKSPGQKIKEIRERYKIKQSQLAGDSITRNLISIIENEKSNLTETTAETIVKNINKFCLENEISFSITVEELMEDKHCQIQKYVSQFIGQIEKQEQDFILGKFNRTLSELVSLLMENDLQSEAFTLYHCLANLYEKNRMYQSAYSYYLQAFQNFPSPYQNSALTELLLHIGYCCIQLQLFEEALYYNDLVRSFCNEDYPKFQGMIRYNNALAYKSLGKVDKALRELKDISKEHFEESSKGKELQKNVLSLQAICLKEKKSYQEAIHIHESSMNHIQLEDTEGRLFVYCNLIEIYLEMKDSKSLKKVINELEDLLETYSNMEDRRFSAQIYYDIAKAYGMIHQEYSHLLYMMIALKEAKVTMNYNIASITMEELLEVAIHRQDELEIHLAKNQMIELLSLGLIGRGDKSIFKLIEYYNSTQDHEGISSLVEFLFQ